MEYLLLLAVVAVVVIAGFGKGALIDRIHDSSQGYYNTVTRVIMGENPKKIDGGWCSVSCPAAGNAKNPNFGPTVMYRACECPSPAFGGAFCPSGNDPTCPKGQTCNGAQVSCGGVTACGPCPTGQSCNASGQCGCPTGLVCGTHPTPTNSIPSSDCTQCICPAGWYYDQGQNACLNHCPARCTTWDGTKCAPLNCSSILPNSYCNPDPNLPVSQECQCVQGTYWNQYQCVYCTSDGTDCFVPNNAGVCAKIDCKALYGFSYCNTATNSCGCDEDPANNFFTYWKGNKCVQGSCTPKTLCAAGSPPYNCGTDTCGGYCGPYNGGCPQAQTCNVTSNGLGVCT